MIGISIAAQTEWEAVLNKFNINIKDCNTFPFGEYFKTNLYGEDVINQLDIKKIEFKDLKLKK